MKHRNLIIRDGNCVATLTVNSDCVEVIFLGGYDEHDSLRANPTILRFGEMFKNIINDKLKLSEKLLLYLFILVHLCY